MAKPYAAPAAPGLSLPLIDQLAELANLGSGVFGAPQQFHRAERCFLQSSKEYEITWAMGATYGSFNVHFERVSKRSIYSGTSNGRLIINFGNLNDGRVATEFRDKLKHRLEGLPVFQISENYRELWPAFPIEKWGTAADQFVRVIHDLLADSSSPDVVRSL